MHLMLLQAGILALVVRLVMDGRISSFSSQGAMELSMLLNPQENCSSTEILCEMALMHPMPVQAGMLALAVRLVTDGLASNFCFQGAMELSTVFCPLENYSSTKIS